MIPILASRPRSAMAQIGFLAIVLAFVPDAISGQPSAADFKLNPDQRVFWGPEYVADAHVPDAALCGIAGKCPRYTIEVRQEAWRLRVALHAMLPDSGDIRFWPDFPQSASEMIFELRVTAPDGCGPQILRPSY